MKIINPRNETIGRELIIGGVIFHNVGYEIYLDTLTKIEAHLNTILIPIILI